MPKERGREGYYIADHHRQDADLHNAILDNGDHAAAHDVSRAVMKRLGLSDDRIDALLKPKT